mgnify:CR=1 FL=1|jgi:hypothetical protein
MVLFAMRIDVLVLDALGLNRRPKPLLLSAAHGGTIAFSQVIRIRHLSFTSSQCHACLAPSITNFLGRKFGGVRTISYLCSQILNLAVMRAAVTPAKDRAS